MTLFQDKFWDLSLPLYKIEGKDSRKFLQGQTTADLLSIEEGTFVRSCWLSPTGRVKSLLEIQLINDCLCFVVLGGNEKDLINGFNHVIFPSDQVEIICEDNIRRIQHMSNKESWKASKTEWIFNDQKLPQYFNNLKSADSYSVNLWIIYQGFPIGLNYMNGTHNPFEIGLSDLVSLDKGCYLGQETLSKLKNIGKVKCELRLFKSLHEFHSGDKLIISDQNSSNQNAGLVTNVIRYDSLYVGLALIKRNYLYREKLDLTNEIGSIEVMNPIGSSYIN
ncbi:folate-binding protein YgfZ [Prochlorococcus marinus]|uniref:CAF17-like 4Fe-4S cluster assembly/insertion protein YgfZ n=1 Tax=Prochlorococcus marinus TaxID=1219 RepID=UPI0022B4BCE6|nr:folate-binding protein YgfZ [Prochlorococcus marinus]